MADATITNPQERLQILQTICNTLASGIFNALEALRNNAEDADMSHLVSDALERLGWMADQASVIAGMERPRVGGDAFGWMLGRGLRSELEEFVRGVKKEASHDQA